eukprot:9458359-Pyramimonas_sp.AAC.1
MGRGRQANPAIAAFGGAPYETTKRGCVCVCAKMGRGRHANPAFGACGGALYVAAKRVRGVPK